MAKTITVRDDVYRKLLRIKREGESFSDLFERLVEGSADSLAVLRRLRGCVEFSDKGRMLEEIYAARAELRR